MKFSRVQWNIIIFTITILLASVIAVLLYQHQKQIEICKITTVNRYLHERYGDNRAGLDIRIVSDVNKEALADCQNGLPYTP